MTPAGVKVMIDKGHTVLVEKNAGAGSGVADAAYEKSGAKLACGLGAKVYLKEGVSRPSNPPPMVSRFMNWTASLTAVWPTCPLPWPRLRPWH
jgi:NAD/NADP transhydrogenase alpha subunit